MAETAAWLLAEALGVAVEVQDAGTLTKADNAEVAWVVVGLEDAPDDALRLAFGEVLQSLGLPVNIQTRRRDDQDWRDGWKAFFRPLRLSTRFAVRPPWEADLPDVAHHIIIDPGMAFGTGQHATTRGVLAALDDLLGDRPRPPSSTSAPARASWPSPRRCWATPWWPPTTTRWPWRTPRRTW
ncbi:MAG: 50S ribosomal protein L11 methyltransferase [bacterium]